MKACTSFVAIDLEMTSAHLHTGRIIEVGLARYIDGQLTEDYERLINPNEPVPEAVTELTGIRDEDLSGCPVFSQVIDEIIDFCGGYPLLGHNVEIDYAFLRQEACYIGQTKRFKCKGMDTLRISRKLIDGGSHRLPDLCKKLSIETEGSHRALSDAHAAAGLYFTLLANYEAGSYGNAKDGDNF